MMAVKPYMSASKDNKPLVVQGAKTRLQLWIIKNHNEQGLRLLADG